MRGESKSKRLLRLSRNQNSNKTSKGKRRFATPTPVKIKPSKLRLVRPRFPKHVCKSEPNCDICRSYCNRLQDWRNSNCS